MGRVPKPDSGNRKTSRPKEPRPELVRLKRIRGQIEGVERMIEDGRYCVDILHQLRSIEAALRGVEGLVLEDHMRHCVKEAMSSKSPKDAEEKISEILNLFSKK